MDQAFRRMNSLASTYPCPIVTRQPRTDGSPWTGRHLEEVVWQLLLPESVNE